MARTKDHRERAVTAEAKAARWLAEANALQEAGKSDTEACARAQHWLDRANELRGWGSAPTPDAGGSPSCNETA